jgi:hypothetical protein
MHKRRVQTTAADWIAGNLGGGPVVREKFIGGSNWSSAYIYTTQQGQEYFVKLAMGGRDDSMFQGEARGLQAMYGACGACMRACSRCPCVWCAWRVWAATGPKHNRSSSCPRRARASPPATSCARVAAPACAVSADTRTLRIPKVHHVGPMPNGRGAFIVMEALQLGGGYSQAELGRQLARMHLAEPSVRAGHWCAACVPCVCVCVCVYVLCVRALCPMPSACAFWRQQQRCALAPPPPLPIQTWTNSTGTPRESGQFWVRG